MTYIISLWLIPNIGQIDPISPSMKIFTLYEHKWYSNPKECYPSPPTLAGSADGKFHEFQCLGDYYLVFERIYAWHTPLIYHIWTIPRSRLISWFRGKVKAGQLTWCQVHGWAWHTSLTFMYGRKWTLERSRLITWPSLPVCPISLSLV